MPATTPKRADRSAPVELHIYRGPGKRTPAVIPPPRPSISQWHCNDQSLDCQFWTFAEWDRLPPKDRPDNAQIQPGVGWVELRAATFVD